MLFLWSVTTIGHTKTGTQFLMNLKKTKKQNIIPQKLKSVTEIDAYFKVNILFSYLFKFPPVIHLFPYI